MQNTPALYKSELKKTGRRPTYVQVYVGLINDQAQKYYARISKDLFGNTTMNLNNPQGEFLPLATWDKNRVAVDGSQRFIAYDYRLINYGFISRELSDSTGAFISGSEPTIAFEFEVPQDMYGITITMDDTYGTVATELTVDGYKGTSISESKLFTNESLKSEMLLTLGFENTDRVVIKINKISKPQQHFRLSRTLMGAGLTFGNYDISNTELSITTDPLSSEIPSYSFKVTLNNVLNQFNFEDPDNFIWFVQNRQKLSVSYGQEIEGGDIVWLKGGTYIVNEPPVVDESTASISAGSVLEYLDFTYDGSSVPSAPADLYTYADAIFRTANKWYTPDGIKFTYALDNGMKSIFTSAPLPRTEVKQALQYIANAAMCSLYVDRDSNIVFKSAYIPTATLASSGGAKYSSNDGILEGQVSSSNYARWSPKFIKVSGLDYFDPNTSTDYHKVGYISQDNSDSNGNFNTPPTFTITYSTVTNVANLRIVSDTSAISQMTITGYRDNVEVFKDTVSPTKWEYTYPDIILGIDKLVISISKISNGNSPLVIKEIDSTERTNVLLARSETAGEPSTTILNPLRAVQVQIYKYTKINTEEVLDEVTVYCPPQSNTTAVSEFNEPVIVSDISISNGRLANSGSTAWIATADISNFGGTGFNSTMTVKGYKVTVTQETYTRTIQANGYVETVDNPLITSKEHAERIAKWIENYAAYPKQYTVPYRGDPSIDAMDFIRYETKVHTTPLTLIKEYTLNVGQGMTGSLVLKEMEE